MNRIFPVLACLALTFLAINMIVGLSLGDLTPDAAPEVKQWATVHRLGGLAAALAVVLVDSIVATYFIGTSRWCKEVAEAYRLDRRFIERSTQLKRSTFPSALTSILTAVAMAALGGAADPAAVMKPPPLGGVSWTQLHLVGSIVGIAIIIWCAFLQWANIQEQRKVIDEILAEVRRIRTEKGLEV